MPRQPPLALAPEQQSALSQFYAGHMSAGELSQRLAQGRSAGGERASSPPRATNARTPGLAVLVVVIFGIAGGAVGAVLGSDSGAARAVVGHDPRLTRQVQHIVDLVGVTPVLWPQGGGRA